MSFLTSVRVIVKEGQAEKYVDAVGKWKAPVDITDTLLKRAIDLSASQGFSRIRNHLCREDLLWLLT